MTAPVLKCLLCSPDLGPVLLEGEQWRLIVNRLNRTQALLGQTFLATRRHVEEVAGLTDDEWVELLPLIRRVTAGIAAVLAPDHWNFAFLMHQERHAHLHIIPRYASPRQFAGGVFEDPAFGRRPPDLALDTRLPEPVFDTFAAELRQAISKTPINHRL
jgi:diadenosine tetraphosphate (Ap4A) HIT family hydrolase